LLLNARQHGPVPCSWNYFLRASTLKLTENVFLLCTATFGVRGSKVNRGTWT